MSDETKRDVMVDAIDSLADAQASGGNIGHQDANLFIADYDAAFPDNLPVIPKAVGVSIKEQKEKQSLGGTIFDAIFAVNTLGRKGVGRVVNWIVDNNEVFALAWVLGVWRVEETGQIVKLEAEE